MTGIFGASRPGLFGVVVFLVGVVGACASGDDPDSSAPEVTSTSPEDGADDVAINSSVTAIFSEEMDGTTLSDATFTLTSGDLPDLIVGTVITTDDEVVFWPSAHLASNTRFTAMITTGAHGVNGLPLGSDEVWTFTTSDQVGATQPVDLGTAGELAILAKTGISTVPPSVITGDIAVSPAAASYLTGFSLIVDASNEFSTSQQVIGDVYAADYSAPTPDRLTQAVGDMERAFDDAAGRAPDVTELGAGNIDGMTLEPGVYKWGSGLLIPNAVTLDGSGNDVWIFQIAQDLTVSGGANVTLAGGAVPENVFWQVEGFVDLGTGAHMEGIVLTRTSATLGTGASINGRLLAQTAVELDQSTVLAP